MVKRMVTVWMSHGPEFAIADLQRRWRFAPDLMDYNVERAEELLARIGYRFDKAQLAKQLTKLQIALEKFNATCDAVFAEIRTERIGPPPGKVCPPHISEWLKQNPGKCWAEEAHDDPPLEPRSRH